VVVLPKSLKVCRTFAFSFQSFLKSCYTSVWSFRERLKGCCTSARDFQEHPKGCRTRVWWFRVKIFKRTVFSSLQQESFCVAISLKPFFNSINNFIFSNELFFLKPAALFKVRRLFAERGIIINNLKNRS
jgi:hypothetical protein